MKFIICDFLTNDDSIIENYFDQTLVKSLAFNCKIKTKIGSGKANLEYLHVLIPIEPIPKQLSNDFLLMQDRMLPNIFSEQRLSEEAIFSIVNRFINGDRSILEKTFLQISVLNEIEGSEMGITYTDGSFKKISNEASYGVSKLLMEDDAGMYDDFSGKKFKYECFSGRVKDGTNNIGELTGLKIAIENFGDSEIQLIISDSEYSIKCFREWFYTWKNNNFRSYSKKEIANKDLIIDIYNLIKKSKKIVLFKWVKGHDNNLFNQLCDNLAKEAFQVKK